MVTLAEFERRYVAPFGDVNYIFSEGRGFIVWRRGSGGNVELLHIKAFERGKGYGHELFREMMEQLACDPPRTSVFGFTWVGNDEAKAFYGGLGFNLQEVDGIYDDGKAILFWQRFDLLCEVIDG